MYICKEAVATNEFPKQLLILSPHLCEQIKFSWALFSFYVSIIVHIQLELSEPNWYNIGRERKWFYTTPFVVIFFLKLYNMVMFIGKWWLCCMLIGKGWLLVCPFNSKSFSELEDWGSYLGSCFKDPWWPVESRSRSLHKPVEFHWHWSWRLCRRRKRH